MTEAQTLSEFVRRLGDSMARLSSEPPRHTILGAVASKEPEDRPEESHE